MWTSVHFVMQTLLCIQEGKVRNLFIFPICDFKFEVFIRFSLPSSIYKFTPIETHKRILDISVQSNLLIVPNFHLAFIKTTEAISFDASR